jgi:hypothetical protein
MLQTCARIIVLTAMVAGPLMTAQAADTTLMACQGTATGGTEDAKPEPVSMGIIVNFTNKTVHGFGDPIFGEQLIHWRNRDRRQLQRRRQGGEHVAKRHGCHRPRDRRCVGEYWVDGHDDGQDHNIDQLRAEMQANTTDVLRIDKMPSRRERRAS